MNHSTKHCIVLRCIVCPAEINEKYYNLNIWMKEQFGCVAALKITRTYYIDPPSPAYFLAGSRERNSAISSIALAYLI